MVLVTQLVPGTLIEYVDDPTVFPQESVWVVGQKRARSGMTRDALETKLKTYVLGLEVWETGVNPSSQGVVIFDDNDDSLTIIEMDVALYAICKARLEGDTFTVVFGPVTEGSSTRWKLYGRTQTILEVPTNVVIVSGPAPPPVVIGSSALLPVDIWPVACQQTVTTDKTAGYTTAIRKRLDDTLTRVAPSGPGMISDGITSRVLTNFYNDLYHQSLSRWSVAILGAYQQYNFHPPFQIYNDGKGGIIELIHTYNGVDDVTHAGAYADLRISQAGEILYQAWEAVVTGTDITGFTYAGRTWPLNHLYSEGYGRRVIDGGQVPEKAQVVATTTEI